MSHDQHTLVPVEDAERFPVPDPGLHHHVERHTDTDPAAGNRAYRQVVAMFGLVPVLAIGFVVAYFAVPVHMTVNFLGTVWPLNSMLLGLTGGLAVLLVGLGAVHWARQLMNDAEVAEERHSAASDSEQRAGFIEKVNEGIADAGVSRRGMILGAASVVRSASWRCRRSSRWPTWVRGRPPPSGPKPSNARCGARAPSWSTTSTPDRCARRISRSASWSMPNPRNCSTCTAPST